MLNLSGNWSSHAIATSQRADFLWQSWANPRGRQTSQSRRVFLCIHTIDKREKDNTSDWESGALGQDLDSAEPVSAEMERRVDAAVNLKPISIRLQADLIDQLKALAARHGIGYQPLIRAYLHRCVREEVHEIAKSGSGER